MPRGTRGPICGNQWSRCVLPFVTISLHWAMCTIPHLPIEHSVTPWLLACFYWNHKWFTWGGCRSSRSSGNNYQYVCHTDGPQSGRNSCLWLFHPLLNDWEGDHWLPQIGPRVPLAMASVLLTRSGGVISSDYYHLSQIPSTGQCVQIPICHVWFVGVHSYWWCT